MARRGGKERVELIEGGDLADLDVVAPGDQAADASDVGDPPQRWHRLRRAWPFALVAVVVAAAYLVTGVRERAAAEARIEILRGQPAFTAGLDRAPDRVWEIDLAGSWAYPVVVDDTLLLTLDLGGTVALDIATGAERWHIDAAENSRTLCGWPSGELESSGGAVGCVEQRFSVSDEGDWTELGSMLQQRDLLTGEVRSEREWPEGVSRATPWQDAVLHLDSGATSTLLRLEGFDGVERWSIPFLDGPLADDEYVSVAVMGGHGIVTAQDRAVVVDFDGEVVLDETTALWGGEEEAHVDIDVGGLAPPELSVWPLDGGGWTVTSWNFQPERTFVFDAAGELAFEAEGSIEDLALDDGSAGDGLAMLRDSWRVHLIDRATGDARFTLDRNPEGPAYLLDESIVWSGGGRLRVIDVATGEERWSEVAEGALVASDGGVVVVHELVTGRARLRAFDLATGVEEWNLGLSGIETSGVYALADALFVLDDGTFARLGG